MARNRRHRKRASLGLAVLGTACAIAAGAVAFGGGGDEAAAAESCQGLDTALQNNLNFIARQQAAPDAQSAARIENREAVVDQLQERRRVAGCTGELVAQPIVAGSGESCAGLDTALRNNQDFIAAQRANPDAQSTARIENRQAVVDLIEQRRAAAGCTGEAEPPATSTSARPPAAGEVVDGVG